MEKQRIATYRDTSWDFPATRECTSGPVGGTGIKCCFVRCVWPGVKGFTTWETMACRSPFHSDEHLTTHQRLVLSPNSSKTICQASDTTRYFVYWSFVRQFDQSALHGVKIAIMRGFQNSPMLAPRVWPAPACWFLMFFACNKASTLGANHVV